MAISCLSSIKVLHLSNCFSNLRRFFSPSWTFIFNLIFFCNVWCFNYTIVNLDLQFLTNMIKQGAKKHNEHICNKDLSWILGQIPLIQNSKKKPYQIIFKNLLQVSYFDYIGMQNVFIFFEFENWNFNCIHTTFCLLEFCLTIFHDVL